jgi:UDP-N-acetyl-D-glucosamine dehydrogenase
MVELVEKIGNENAEIGIIGLGYTGLPLAIAFSKKFHVAGYDVNKSRVNALLKGESHINDVKNEELKIYLNQTFFPTNNYEELKKCDFIIICVPTPLKKDKEPDLSYVKSACEVITKILRKKHFIILESTTYPGTTEEIVVPILERSGLKAGIDFGVAYSPERVDPGSGHNVENIPKIVAGLDQKCTDIVAKLYEHVFAAEVIKVKDCKTAEATKMFENIFRDVNIALVNEFALICERIGINVWSVVEAASTKPFGFMPFYPGPGVGGHCIPLDPYYMSYKAKKFGFIPRFIELSGEINEFMRIHAVNLVGYGLSKVGLSIRDSTIAVIGLAYKKDIDDVRESPAKKIIEEIANAGGNVKAYDPYAKSIDTSLGTVLSEKTIEDAIHDSNCAIFVTNHTIFKSIDLNEIATIMKSPVIIDCMNIFTAKKSKGEKYVYYGIGKSMMDISTYL